MTNPTNRATPGRAHQLLRKSVGESATFRPHQWEAIDKLVNYNERLLIVQRTGWGKSTVYFIATHLLRDRGNPASSACPGYQRAKILRTPTQGTAR